jgi:hypothetical protein
MKRSATRRSSQDRREVHRSGRPTIHEHGAVDFMPLSRPPGGKKLLEIRDLNDGTAWVKLRQRLPLEIVSAIRATLA